jgi:hypothetical protein
MCKQPTNSAVVIVMVLWCVTVTGSVTVSVVTVTFVTVAFVTVTVEQ